MTKPRFFSDVHSSFALEGCLFAKTSGVVLAGLWVHHSPKLSKQQNCGSRGSAVRGEPGSWNTDGGCIVQVSCHHGVCLDIMVVPRYNVAHLLKEI